MKTLEENSISKLFVEIFNSILIYLAINILGLKKNFLTNFSYFSLQVNELIDNQNLMHWRYVFWLKKFFFLLIWLGKNLIWRSFYVIHRWKRFKEVMHKLRFKMSFSKTASNRFVILFAWVFVDKINGLRIFKQFYLWIALSWTTYTVLMNS